MRIALSLETAGSQVELYAKLGSPPTRSIYDFSYNGVASQAEDIIIPSASQGSWYILIYGAYMPQVTLYSLQVLQQNLFLESFAPNLSASTLNTTLTLDGAGFTSASVVNLFSTNGTLYPAESVVVNGTTQLQAFFSSNSLPAGVYEVCVSSGASTACDTNTLTMLAVGLPNFQASIVVPSVLGFHQPATIYVDYANTGTAPMPAPLLLLTGTESGQPGPILTLEASEQSAIGEIEQTLLSNYTSGMTSAPPGFTTTAQILASGSVPGLLQPGESYRIPVYYAGWLEPWNFSRPPLIFSLSVYTANDNTAINWASYGTSFQPSGVSNGQWANLLGGMETSFGTTWGSYVSALEQLVNLAPPVDGSAYADSQLFDIAYDQISGFGNAEIAGQVIDTTTNQPVPNVRVYALLQSASGVSMARTVETDIHGNFLIANLPPGTYQISIDDYYSLAPYLYTLTNQEALANVTLGVSPDLLNPSPPQPDTHTNESTPVVQVDSSGTAHLVWTRGSFIWHAYFNGTQWVCTGSLPNAIGTDPVIIAGTNFVDGNLPGLMIAWCNIVSNRSTLYYTVATNASGTNGWQFSLPTQLNETNTLENEGLALSSESDGQVVAVWQKENGAIVDDTDLYYAFLHVASNSLNWPTNEIAKADNVHPQDEQNCFSISYNNSIFTIPDSIPIVGGDYGWNITGQYCGTSGCEPSFSLAGSGGFYAPHVTTALQIQGNASWVTDPNACQYIPDVGNFSRA